MIVSTTGLKIGFVLFIGTMKANMDTLSLICQSSRNTKLVKNRLLKWIKSVRGVGTSGYTRVSSGNRPSSGNGPSSEGGGRFIIGLQLIPQLEYKKKIRPEVKFCLR